MSYLIERIPCPGTEFGLEPCEEHVVQRYRKERGGGWVTGDELIAEDEVTFHCTCFLDLEQRRDGSHTRYMERVVVLLDAAPLEEDWDEDEYT